MNDRDTSNEKSRWGEPAVLAGQILALASLYVVTGILGLQLGEFREGVTLVWPPAGLSLAALILFGRRLWPGIFIGTMLVGFSSANPNWFAMTGLATGNTLEAVVGVTLLVQVAHFRPNLERMWDGIAFLLIGVLGCTTIGATIGVWTNYIFGIFEYESLAFTWLVWWLGSMGGALVVTPALLLLVRGTPSWQSLAKRVESWLILALVVGTTAFAFFGPSLGVLGYAMSISPVPVLVWAGTRLGPRGATLASLVIILTAIIATGMDVGPFVLGTGTESVFLLWAYTFLIGITAYTLAAVVEQRARADRLVRSILVERSDTEKRQLLLVERARLTRELHDGLGGQLVSVLAMIERGLAASSEIAEALRRAIDDIRIIIDSLDAETTDLPLSLGKLRVRIEPQLRRNGIVLTWIVDDDIDADILSAQSVLHVVRIIQEAVTNSLRHANAGSIFVRIGLDDERRELQLSIRDNGQGLPTPISVAGRGVRNMNSRAAELGGEISIDNNATGAQIDLTIPLVR